MSLSHPPSTGRPVRPVGPARPVGHGGPVGPGAGGQDRAAARRRRRALTLLLLTLVAPGSAQVMAGRARGGRIGRLVLRVWAGFLGCVLLIALVWFVHRPFVLSVFTHGSVLRLLALLLFAGALCWPLLMLDAWRLGEVRLLAARSRRRLALTAAVLAVVTCLLPIAAGRRVWAAADLLGGIFSSGRTSAAVDGRYNVLLLGGDAGPNRIGTRPDSVTLASIDEKSGRTALISLPRNLQNVPFPAGTPAAKALPQGWSCGDDCLLNALYQYGSQHPQYFPGVADPGAEAMKQAVQAVTGLTVNYYVLVDLRGFRSMIDAVGGIDLTATGRVPIGGGTSAISGWIEPGKQHLNGFRALWYARSREGSSDYERMARQRCVMTAMVNQLDPATLLGHFEDIAAAGRQVVSTDIPASALAQFISLGKSAKSHRIESVQFVPPLIVPHHPDYGVIRARVAAVIEDVEKGPDVDKGDKAPSSPRAAASSPPAGGSPASEATPSPAPGVDIREVCSAT